VLEPIGVKRAGERRDQLAKRGQPRGGATLQCVVEQTVDLVDGARGVGFVGVVLQLLVGDGLVDAFVRIDATCGCQWKVRRARVLICVRSLCVTRREAQKLCTPLPLSAARSRSFLPTVERIMSFTSL
jgi:hypothetical protein